MMPRRPSTEEMRLRLKRATKAAVRDAGTAADLVKEGLVRVGEASLSFAASLRPEHDDRSIALDVALDLDFLAGEPYHARALAEAQGYRLEADDRAKGSAEISPRGLTRIERVFSNAILAIRDALEDDDEIDAREAAALLPDLCRLEAEISRKRAKLEGLAGRKTA